MLRNPRASMSVSKRISVLFIAAMQLVMPPVLTVADGYLDAASPESAVFAHVEAHSSSKCARVHNEETCAICHFLSRAAANKPEGQQFPLRATQCSSNLPAISWASPHDASRNPTLPRAPPIA